MNEWLLNIIRYGGYLHDDDGLMPVADAFPCLLTVSVSWHQLLQLPVSCLPSMMNGCPAVYSGVGLKYWRCCGGMQPVWSCCPGALIDR